MSDILERTLAGLKSALAVSPRNGPLWLQVAEILSELGRDNEALDAAAEADEHLPEGEDRNRARALVGKLSPEPPPEEDSPNNVIRLVRGDASDDDEDDEGGYFAPKGETVTFADVGGLDEIKETIRMRIVLPFQRPEIFEAYGKSKGGGILLYGPPGCGKTLLARATAGECDAEFMNIAIDQVLDMWHGESERKLAAIFEEARRRAPAVLFFDEVEAVGGSRQQMRNTAGRSLVNQLLAQMDGASGKNDKVLVMAATNAPWHVDPALRRPGRFDRVVFVPPPDNTARAEILRLCMKGKPAEAGLDLSWLAKKTDSYSGADLNDLIERAIEAPLRDALQSGEIRPLASSDMKKALKDSRPTTREWFATAKNYASFANTGGLYDELLAYNKR